MTGQLGRILLIVGVLAVVAGLLLLLFDRIGLGRLPGDIVWRGENWTVYVPLGWMILLSVVLTVILNLMWRR